MNNNEKRFILEVCDIVSPDKRKIEKLINRGAATTEVLGELLCNRMGGVAYKVLSDCGLLYSVDREFRNTLKNIFSYYEQYNQSYEKALSSVSYILTPYIGKYVMLRGAYLSPLFPRGCRTSNNLDILVAPENLSEIGAALINGGFRQGKVREGEFVPVHHTEIINSGMRGETVHYIKEVNLPHLKYLVADLSFSFGYKGGDSVKDIINSSSSYVKGELCIPIPCVNDFLIHLCANLYKEASEYPFIRLKRDMMLYKYCDIQFLLNRSGMPDAAGFVRRAEALGLADACYYTLNSVYELFSDKVCKAMKDMLAPYADRSVMVKVFSPEEKKLYIYDESIKKRFFTWDRCRKLIAK